MQRYRVVSLSYFGLHGSTSLRRSGDLQQRLEDRRRDCHENLASAEGKSEEFGLDSSRGRCPPIPEGFASEGAERVAGNKMALNVERVMDDGVNG